MKSAVFMRTAAGKLLRECLVWISNLQLVTDNVDNVVSNVLSRSDLSNVC